MSKYGYNHITEIREVYSSLWNNYMNFYTVFMVVNLTGLGLVANASNAGSLWLVIIAFISMNVFSLFTALKVGDESKRLHNDQKLAIENLMISKKKEGIEVLLTPLPRDLALWAGRANAAAHFAFILCWCGLWIASSCVCCPCQTKCKVENQSVLSSRRNTLLQEFRPLSDPCYYPQISQQIGHGPALSEIRQSFPSSLQSERPRGASPFLAKYPPSLAINIIASAIVGATVVEQLRVRI